MPDHTQPRKGYYTATEARIILGKSRVAFGQLVNKTPELLAARVKNTADGRSWLYPAEMIDTLAAHAVPTLDQEARAERAVNPEILAWLDANPTASQSAMQKHFGISYDDAALVYRHWLALRRAPDRTRRNDASDAAIKDRRS